MRRRYSSCLLGVAGVRCRPAGTGAGAPAGRGRRAARVNCGRQLPQHAPVLVAQVELEVAGIAVPPDQPSGEERAQLSCSMVAHKPVLVKAEHVQLGLLPGPVGHDRLPLEVDVEHQLLGLLQAVAEQLLEDEGDVGHQVDGVVPDDDLPGPVQVGLSWPSSGSLISTGAAEGMGQVRDDRAGRCRSPPRTGGDGRAAIGVRRPGRLGRVLPTARGRSGRRVMTRTLAPATWTATRATGSPLKYWVYPTAAWAARATSTTWARRITDRGGPAPPQAPQGQDGDRRGSTSAEVPCSWATRCNERWKRGRVRAAPVRTGGGDDRAQDDHHRQGRPASGGTGPPGSGPPERTGAGRPCRTRIVG